MFDKPQPCIVELFGHQVIAGAVTEQTIGGSSFIRVDVPEVDGLKSFTKFFGASAIYAMTPVDESMMLAAVRGYRVKPVEIYRLALPGKVEGDADDLEAEAVDHDRAAAYEDFGVDDDEDNL